MRDSLLLDMREQGFWVFVTVILVDSGGERRFVDVSDYRGIFPQIPSCHFYKAI